jgi:type III restriction enzyme
MLAAVIDNPILNSPFAEPSSHWELDENGIPTGIAAEGRRCSGFIVPVPPPKHKVTAQASLGLEDGYGKRQANDYINEIRGKVAQWRSLGEYRTARLALAAWDAMERSELGMPTSSSKAVPIVGSLAAPA